MTGALSCSDCGEPLKPNPRRKGTRCQPCMRRNRPRSVDELQRMRAKNRATYADPAFKVRHSKACAEAQARAVARNPELALRRREHGLKLGRSNIGRQMAEQTKAKIGQKATERQIGWCPPEYRDDYRDLVRSQGIPAAQARQMIETQIEVDLQRALSTGTLQQSTRESRA